MQQPSKREEEEEKALLSLVSSRCTSSLSVCGEVCFDGSSSYYTTRRGGGCLLYYARRRGRGNLPPPALVLLEAKSPSSTSFKLKRTSIARESPIILQKSLSVFLPNGVGQIAFMSGDLVDEFSTGDRESGMGPSPHSRPSLQLGPLFGGGRGSGGRRGEGEGREWIERIQRRRGGAPSPSLAVAAASFLREWLFLAKEGKQRVRTPF